MSRLPTLLALAGLLAAAAVLGLAFGSAESPTREIVLEIRLPRVVLGMLVGAGLATAGALLQALLQNPLADPFLLGISGGAALGGVAAVALGGGALLGLSVPALAFAGALGATALLYAIAAAGGRAPAHSLLLTGVVFNAFASSVIVFLTTAVELNRVAGVFLWLIGSIRLVDDAMIACVAALIGLGLGVGLYYAYSLNLLTQGDEAAAHLGVDVPRVRRHVLLATALMIGASVAVSGIVGFVGLIVPHLLRLVVGADHRVLIPASALFGAALVTSADTLARTVLAPTELPVGAFTALIGGPLFLWLLRRELSR
ncbi:MAG: iron ABC transporter permease [Deltaproteobacteria bacterium]|nr:iron ABC transporter permease [Deltaproteobacteria bacterium]MBW2414518.1 iron ABC transporter permease [Deltaproteobacteria bacterium]